MKLRFPGFTLCMGKRFIKVEHEKKSYNVKEILKNARIDFTQKTAIDKISSWFGISAGRIMHCW